MIVTCTAEDGVGQFIAREGETGATCACLPPFDFRAGCQGVVGWWHRPCQYRRRPARIIVASTNAQIPAYKSTPPQTATVFTQPLSSRQPSHCVLAWPSIFYDGVLSHRHDCVDMLNLRRTRKAMANQRAPRLPAVRSRRSRQCGFPASPTARGGEEALRLLDRAQDPCYEIPWPWQSAPAPCARRPRIRPSRPGLTSICAISVIILFSPCDTPHDISHYVQRQPPPRIICPRPGFPARQTAGYSGVPEAAPCYRSPVADVAFTLPSPPAASAKPMRQGLYGDLDDSLVDAVLEEAGRFAGEQLAPINHIGDQFGTPFKDGKITMPPGWKKPYTGWAAAGWNGLAAPPNGAARDCRSP